MNSNQMKKVKYLLISAFTMVIAFVASSCTDGNDWDKDSSKDAYFAPHSLNGSVQSGILTLTWETYDKADSYQIEIIGSNGQYILNPNIPGCKYNGNEMAPGTITSDVVPGVTSDVYYNVTDEESVKNRSFVWPETLAPGQYQLRIRALASNGKNASSWHWYYNSTNGGLIEISGSGDEE